MGSRPDLLAHLSRFSVHVLSEGSAFTSKKYCSTLEPRGLTLTHLSFCFLFAFSSAASGRWMNVPSNQSLFSLNRCASTYRRPVRVRASRLVLLSSSLAPSLSALYSAGRKIRTFSLIMGFPNTVVTANTRANTPPAFNKIGGFWSHIGEDSPHAERGPGRLPPSYNGKVWGRKTAKGAD